MLTSLFIFQKTELHLRDTSKMNSDSWPIDSKLIEDDPYRQNWLETSDEMDPPPSPPRIRFPLDSPKERRIFLTLVMTHTRSVPPHLRIHEPRILVQIFKFFGLYDACCPGHGFYCATYINMEKGDKPF